MEVDSTLVNLDHIDGIVIVSKEAVVQTSVLQRRIHSSSLIKLCLVLP